MKKIYLAEPEVFLPNSIDDITRLDVFDNLLKHIQQTVA